ncbi:MAG: glutamate racemase [Alphaproteobacteria bacterium]
MIGLFDSGHGGLTIFRALVGRFPEQQFVYLGDHANAPYGNRDSREIVDLTRKGVEQLYSRGCTLVVLACNTASAVACRTLQQDWLPSSGYAGHNILGVVAPVVEAATQTPWAMTSPQYPQKYNTDTIAVFGTTRTVASGVYSEEIRKRCPKVTVLEQACPDLAGAIEMGAGARDLDLMVETYVNRLLERAGGQAPERTILGCTHFPLIEDMFVTHLPSSTRILSQPDVVADSLEDYLARHPDYRTRKTSQHAPKLLTTGKPDNVSLSLELFWPQAHDFEALG